MFIKKWKEILLFVFPIFVLFFGCFKLIESLIEFSSFKRFERTEIEMENYSERLDSLKKLSEISKAHIFVAWNVDSLKDMVFKENVKIEFLQMEKNSGSGKFLGKFDSLQSLLEDRPSRTGPDRGIGTSRRGMDQLPPYANTHDR